MSFQNTLNEIIKKHADLEQRMASPDKDFAVISKEYSDLTPIVEKAKAFQKRQQDFEEAEEMLRDPEIDAEMKEMAESERDELHKSLPKLEKELQIMLLPKDEDDERNAILEVRAGAGGDEAGLFAAQLFRMYNKYADIKGWKFETMSISDTGIGGYKEASANITGKNVFRNMKFESGVHRVQRVPETESGGRIHTSTATVAVLPEAEEVDFEINETDLRIDVFRASGPGGQSVNTTDSAVRIVHIPTGVTVQQQDEKSQHKNKAKAMKILRSRLYEMERQKKEQERAAERKGQVGTGDRSERIRTYNFPQSRITDHRIGKTVHNIDEVMEGSLDELIDALITEDEAMKLAGEGVSQFY